MQVRTNLLTAELVEGCHIRRKQAYRKHFFPPRFGNKKRSLRFWPYNLLWCTWWVTCLT